MLEGSREKVNDEGCPVGYTIVDPFLFEVTEVRVRFSFCTHSRIDCRHCGIRAVYIILGCPPSKV